MPASRTWTAIRAAALVIIAWLLYREFAPLAPDILAAWRSATPRPGYLAASATLVLASYALLIEVWRRVVTAAGGELRYTTAAHIWLVSNLGRYLPGKVWAIAAMGALAQRAGVSAVSAMGSSVLIAVVHVLAGIALVAALGRGALSLSLPVALVVIALASAVIVAPTLLPWAATRVAAIFGRQAEWRPLPRRTVAIAFAGCAAGWLLQGLAFKLLVMGVVGTAAGASSAYIAVFTASYLAGFLFLPAPGGIGVREGVLAGLLGTFGLAAAGPAAVIVLASRAWLTILELIPGLFLLPFTPKPPTPQANDV